MTQQLSLLTLIYASEESLFLIFFFLEKNFKS